MATRFCGNCGTEVDDDASFCPSCGRAIDAGVGSGSADRTAAIPAAPAWPEPARDAAPEAAPAEEPEPRSVVFRGGDPARQTAEPAVEPVAAQAAPPAPATGDGAPPNQPPPPPAAAPPAAGYPAAGTPPPPAGTQVDLPITWPVTMSGWLIGGGSFVAAIGFLADMFAFRGAGSAVSVIMLLLTLGIAATVFLSATVPAIPHLRLATLCIVFIAFGIALDRLGFNAAGFGTLLVLLGAGAAAAGAVILELGRDQPMSGPMDRR